MGGRFDVISEFGGLISGNALRLIRALTIGTKVLL
jgi:hypothetical protein